MDNLLLLTKQVSTSMDTLVVKTVEFGVLKHHTHTHTHTHTQRGLS